MSAMASQITSLTIVYSTVYSGTEQRKHQSYASLAFVRGIRRWHKRPVTRKMFPLDDVIMVMLPFCVNYYVTACVDNVAYIASVTLIVFRPLRANCERKFVPKFLNIDLHLWGYM